MGKSSTIWSTSQSQLPRCKAHDGFTYWNPGSVSIPKENSHRGYMLLEGDRAVWKELDGDTVMETKICPAPAAC